MLLLAAIVGVCLLLIASMFAALREVLEALLFACAIIAISGFLMRPDRKRTRV